VTGTPGDPGSPGSSVGVSSLMGMMFEATKRTTKNWLVVWKCGLTMVYGRYNELVNGDYTGL